MIEIKHLPVTFQATKDGSVADLPAETQCQFLKEGGLTVKDLKTIDSAEFCLCFKDNLPRGDSKPALVSEAKFVKKNSEVLYLQMFGLNNNLNFLALQQYIQTRTQRVHTSANLEIFSTSQ